jgi:flagellar biosynthesis/type III secretory pathway M-ring protein FliF/YscJ
MDFIRNQIGRLQQQLAGLSASQKMLSGTLVVIMMMTIVWWTRYAGDAELQPLFSQAMSVEEARDIGAALNAAGVKARVDGVRVLVSPDDVLKAWSVLSFGQMLPRDTRASFEDMLKSSSPFEPPEKTKAIFKEYLQNRLAAIIARYPGVASAMVNVDSTHERGPHPVDASASVAVTMKRGESASPAMVEAAADLVSGAVSNLQRGRVKVIVDGVSWPVKNRDDTAVGVQTSDEYLRQVRAAEAYYHDKLAQQFNWLQGAFFSVTVKPNNERKDSEIKTVDAKNVLVKPVSENLSTEETHNSTRGGAEVGTVSNAPLTAGPAETVASDGSGSTIETNKIESVEDHGWTKTRTLNPGGDLVVTSAAVHVPRSYYALSYRLNTRSDKDPEPAALETYIKAELVRLSPAVKSALGLASDEAVHVDVFTDLMPAPVPGGPAAAAVSSSLTLAVTDHVKEIALGVLALFSLLMVSNMVKKSTPAPAAPMAAPKPPIEPMSLDSVDSPVGEAHEGVTALEGIELNDEEAKGHQMQQQVTDMVSSDPQSAADLVKRWLNHT